MDKPQCIAICSKFKMASLLLKNSVYVVCKKVKKVNFSSETFLHTMSMCILSVKSELLYRLFKDKVHTFYILWKKENFSNDIPSLSFRLISEWRSGSC